MTTTDFANKLNRRHKVALCSTLICVGLILLLGGGIRTAVGIMLLGVAFSWALGSNSRLIHWLFVVFGLLLLLTAALDGYLWPRTKAKWIETQTSIIKSDRDLMDSDVSLIAHETDRQELRREQEEYRKQIDEWSKDERELRSVQAEGIFRHVVKNDWGTAIGGLLLLSAGLGLIVGVRPMRKSPPESPR